jgi:cystathionine beta-lyase
MTKRTLGKSWEDTTRTSHSGRGQDDHQGLVNVPVHRASTILFPTLAALRDASHSHDQMAYGRQGTPSTFALQDAIAALERDGSKTLVVPSGASAITTALLSVARPGGHLLVTDAVYETTRQFCDGILKKFGVQTTYYDPTIGAGIADLIQPETVAIFMENPGSFTFDLQDIPAMVEAAKSHHGVVTILDNTWGTPLFFKPLSYGIDISMQAITKYIGGHADLMMGSITAGGKVFNQLRRTVQGLGLFVSPDDCFLALRGLRTLAPRLDRHQATGFALARWLEARPEVSRVLHPGLESFPGHDLWKRDFTGASGLFSFVVPADADVAAMVDGMALFGIGYSWGGYESLILPANMKTARSAVPWDQSVQILRVHAGLEDPDDLIADLEAGLSRL